MQGGVIVKQIRSAARWAFPRSLPLVVFCALCSLPSSAQELDALDGRLVDLTYSFDETTVFWPTAEGFQLDVLHAGNTEAGFYYAANQFSLAEHGGTHLDAPVHFSEGMQTADEIPLDRLIGSAIIVDVTEHQGHVRCCEMK